MQLTQSPPRSAEGIFDLLFGFIPARVLQAGIELDVFTPLHDGPKTAAEVATHAKATERGVRMLLDVLASIRILDKRGERYELTQAAARHLVRTSEEYLGAAFERPDMWHSWGSLADAVRSGEPTRRVEEEALASQFFPVLVKSLHAINRDVGRRAARELGKGLPAQDARILDVAAGSAVWSIPFAEDLSQARVTALDFAQVLDTTRAYAKRHGVGDRFDYIEGNLRDVDLGEGRFDLAVLGNIIHSEGEASTRDLFGRLHRSLRASGRVAILDMIPEDDRSGPVFPLGFALNMLLHTAEGDTYTFAQISQWLKDAGFTAVDRVDIQFHSPMIVATR